MFTSTARRDRPARPKARGIDLAITALVLSVAAMAWFGWGQAQPPPSWSAPLIAGSCVSIAAVLLTGVTTWRHRRDEQLMNDPAVRRGYWLIVGVEVAACALGVAALAIAGKPDYFPAWILLVVGVHFVPLGRLFGIVELYPAGLAASAAAIAAAVTGAVSAVAPSAVAGAGGGLACLVAALSCARRVRTVPREDAASREDAVPREDAVSQENTVPQEETGRGEITAPREERRS